LLSAIIKLCPATLIFLNIPLFNWSLLIVTVSPVTAVVMPVPPTMLNVSSLALAAVEPESPVNVL
jgi:hypothetical protein